LPVFAAAVPAAAITQSAAVITLAVAWPAAAVAMAMNVAARRVAMTAQLVVVTWLKLLAAAEKWLECWLARW
jgi:hypothetical protein